MIDIVGRKVNIPAKERNIGFQGDNLVETRIYVISDLDLSNLVFKLDIEKSDGIKDIINLNKEVSENKILLTWTILEPYISVEGELKAQIRGFDGIESTDIRWHSDIHSYWVDKSINAANAQPSILPSEFIQLEERLTELEISVEENAENASLSEQNAKNSEEASKISETNAKASEEASKQSEDNAKESEINSKTSEDNSKSSETITNQTMTDFLNMLGTDVATLIDGKLNPSQIPNLSINEVFTITSESEMTELTAQRGDCAILVEDDIVTDSYILSTDDPTQSDNWKKLGVSYVANAGHSQTANTAENSNKINNHRMVEMTQEEFDIAVKEENTYYLVY